MSTSGPFSDRDRVVSGIANLGRLGGVLATTVAAGAAPALAIGGGLSEANAKLGNYGFPPIVFVPPGFQPLVSEYGRGNNQKAITNPILIQFTHPSGWVVQKTSVNNNGESGTVGANDYMKGDSANFFEFKLKPGDKVDASSKAVYSSIIDAALGRKGDVLESVSVLKVEPLTTGLKGEQYFRVYFQYSLNTEAGFLIARQGLMSVTEINGYAECLVTGSTTKRWKQKMEPIMKDIVDTFRVYKLDSGIFATN